MDSNRAFATQGNPYNNDYEMPMSASSSASITHKPVTYTPVMSLMDSFTERLLCHFNLFKTAHERFVCCVSRLNKLCTVLTKHHFNLMKKMKSDKAWNHITVFMNKTSPSTSSFNKIVKELEQDNITMDMHFNTIQRILHEYADYVTPNESIMFTEVWCCKEHISNLLDIFFQSHGKMLESVINIQHLYGRIDADIQLFTGSFPLN